MSGAPGAASTPTLPRSATPGSVMSVVALGRKEEATSMRRFCLLLAVSNPLWQPNLDFSSFRSVPSSLSQQTRAEGRNIRPIWKVSLVFKENMISDSDETMTRRCAASAFLGYPHSLVSLNPPGSVYVLIHFHPSLHASLHCKPKVEIALLFSLLRGGRHSSSVHFWSKHQGHQHRGFRQ